MRYKVLKFIVDQKRLKIFKHSSLQRLKILSVLGDSAYIFLAL